MSHELEKCICGNGVAMFTERQLAGNPKLWHNGKEEYHIICPSCGLDATYHTFKAKTVKLWNERPDK